MKGADVKMINISEIETKYTIYSDGRVFNKNKGREIKGSLSNCGYNRVTVCGNRLSRHRLIAMKFLPKIDGKEYINHIDGNKLNNNVSNLEWCTSSENAKHAFDSGLRCAISTPIYGEENNNAILTDKEVIKIRSTKDLSQNELAERFNVSKSTIKHILRGRSWTHLIDDNFKPISLKNKRVKININIARCIRERVKAGETQISLSKEYDIDKSAISKIVKNITWKENGEL